MSRWLWRGCLVVFIGWLVVPVVRASQASDLDALMQRVLASRDENWKKLQQYVLDEREQIELIGPARARLWGQSRDYTWFIRDGVFVRSPLRANGVTVSETDRRKYEDDFITRTREREKAAADRAKTDESPNATTTDVAPDAMLTGLSQPQFIDSAYFLKFKFEPGRYSFVGRETLEGHDVLRIEYYPNRLFGHEQEQQERRVKEGKPNDDVETALERSMNKVSLVTLWVEPKAAQIVKYTLDNVDLDFLPVAWLVRTHDMKAEMSMDEVFPGVWLPKRIRILMGGAVAAGSAEARYSIDYHDYREAKTSGSFKVVGQ